jgi:hypothetical protein
MFKKIVLFNIFFFLIACKTDLKNYGDNSYQVSEKRNLLNLKQYEIEGVLMHDSIRLISLTEDTVLFKDIPKSKPLLFVYISSTFCNECVISTLRIVNDFYSEKNDNNVLIVGHYPSLKSVKLLLRSNNISLNMFLCENPIFTDLGNPLIAIADGDNKLKMVHLPDNNYEFFRDYLKIISNKYY